MGTSPNHPTSPDAHVGSSRLPSGSRWVWTPIIHGGGLSSNIPSLDISAFSYSHVFPRITFQINRLPPWPCLAVCFGCPQLRKYHAHQSNSISTYQRGHILVPNGMLSLYNIFNKIYMILQIILPHKSRFLASFKTLLYLFPRVPQQWAVSSDQSCPLQLA